MEISDVSNIKPEVHLFLQDLLAEKGIQVDEETERDMIAQLHDRLQALFMQVVVSELDEQGMETFERLAGEGEQALQGFLAEKIPNINELFMRAMAEFRRAFLQG